MYHVSTFLGENCSVKLNDMFVSCHNKYDWKLTCDYVGKCHIISKQVHSQ